MVASSGIVTSELWVEHDGKRVYGRLHLPDGLEEGERIPAVICSHFFGGTHRASSVWARLMARAGYAAYAFDFCGGSPKSRSTGSTTECSIKTEAADLSAILDAIKALAVVDPTSVFLLGQSQGGAVSAMVAAERPSDVAGLVLLYPAFIIHEDAVRRFGSPENVPETYVMWHELGRVYAVDALAYDFFEHIGAFTGPVLMFQGTADDMEPPALTDRAATLYADVDYEHIEGAGHEFFGDDRTHVAERIVAFISEHASAACNGEAEGAPR